MRKFCLLVLTVALGLSTGACALLFPSRLDGLAVARIERMGPVIHADRPTSAGWTTFQRRGVYAGELIAVDIVSERDLHAFAADNEYHVGVEATFCREGAPDPARPLQDSVYVYDPAGYLVDAYRASGAAGSAYRVYVAVKSMPLAGQEVFAYDLRAAPANICLQVRGGNMLGASFKSNVLVIPASAITSALATGQR